MKRHVVGWQRSLLKTPPKHSQSDPRRGKLRRKSAAPRVGRAVLAAGSLKN